MTKDLNLVKFTAVFECQVAACVNTVFYMYLYFFSLLGSFNFSLFLFVRAVCLADIIMTLPSLTVNHFSALTDELAVLSEMIWPL